MHYTYLPVVYASHLKSGSLPNVVPRKSNSYGTKKRKVSAIRNCEKFDGSLAKYQIHQYFLPLKIVLFYACIQSLV